MPGSANGTEARRKRKRDNALIHDTVESKNQVPRKELQDEVDIEAEMLLMETQILESRRNYNSISTLLEYLGQHEATDQRNVIAAVALCRIFCRLMALGNMTKTQDSAENEIIIIQWLKERYEEYLNALLELLGSDDASCHSMALTILMRSIKEEAEHLNLSEDAVWRSGVFTRVLRLLVDAKSSKDIREEFMTRFLIEYDDIRYHTCTRLADFASADVSTEILNNIIFMLAAMKKVPETQEAIQSFFLSQAHQSTHSLRSLTAHKKQVQEAWLAILRRDLTKAQRKMVLGLMSRQIAPWLLKVELLMDFLTDSFNVGGSTSLMALSGLFYLIQEKNLDYPQFYHKLYSLLDAEILHSKHRSQFFRLLDRFLLSTHLPAALVASFIKRLSRLTLHAPPSGIVVVVPWIYNLLKNHPACTFMIHRKPHGNRDVSTEVEEGWGDPFRMEESDPMETGALESSLWEIQMLQSHYHPNIATIAKIVSEQFTKQAYNLEDFLDHSYGSILDADLSKDVKNPPEVEYEIPKRIFFEYGANSVQQSALLMKLWDFS